MQTVAISNQKGGVEKTALAFSLVAKAQTVATNFYERRQK
jgi:cellulose biosynthesis protein BcsQ